MRWTSPLFFWVALLSGLGTHAGELPLRIVIEAKFEETAESGGLRIEGQRIAATGILSRLYQARGYEALWSNTTRAQQALAGLATSAEDGLEPADYHGDALDTMTRELRDPDARTPAALAAFDLLLSDAIARRVYHLEFGKVDPRQLVSSWNMDRDVRGLDPVDVLQQVVTAPDIRAAVESHRPQNPIYSRALAALARYRSLSNAGGWGSVPEGPALKVGMNETRVVALRRRLTATGELPPGLPVSGDFDDEVERAVSSFQRRHFLDPDGVAGNETVAAMNVPVTQRIDQIRANLERGRWVLHDLRGDFVLVDIAGFEAMLFRNNREIWRSRAQVGRPYRKTPVFKSRMTYLEFNPTWTIPPGILRRDTLPAVQRDPNYLSDRNIRVYDADGVELASGAVDWTRYPAEPFPYRLVQDPGPNNALGRVKFMFPNRHLVFLHDTPSRALFERSERTFSSGCVRIAKPFELAELLLNDPEAWDPESIAQAVESQRTRVVSLTEPTTVIILYWTIDLPAEGQVRFKRDVYARDGPLLRALEGGFEVHTSLPSR